MVNYFPQSRREQLMASKKTTRVNNGELDFSADLDFKFDDSFDLVQKKIDRKNRSPIRDVVRGTVSGAYSKIKTGSFWHNVAKNALPKSYSVVSEEFKKSKDLLSASYQESVSALRPELSRVGRQVDKLVPEEAKRLKRLSSRFNKEETQYKGQSAEAMESQMIAQAQAEIFDRVQQASDSKEARDRAEQRIKDKIDSKRFSSSLSVLTHIDHGIQHIASYTTSVNASFQKKSLELQYRSYFVQAELLKTQNKYNELFKAYFEAIKENTALPDFVKITKSEQFKQIAQNKLFAAMSGSLSAGVGRVTKRIGQYARGGADALKSAQFGLDGLLAAKDSLQMAKELGINESIYTQGGGLLGGFFANMLGTRFGKAVGKRIPKDGKIIKGLTKTARFVTDPYQFFSKIRGSDKFKERKNKGGFTGGLFTLLDTLMGDFKAPEPDNKIVQGRAAGSIAAHPFTDKAHKSLVEIIPGYLARILQETTAIRMGSKELGPMSLYDWKSSRFTSSKNIRSSIANELTKIAKNTSTDYTLDEAVKGFAGKELKGAQNKRVKQFMHGVSGERDLDYNSDAIFNTPAFKKLPRKDQDIIRKQLTKLRGSEDGKLLVTELMSKAKDARQTQESRVKEMLHRYSSDGYQDLLEKMGFLIRNNEGGYDYNEKKGSSFLQGVSLTHKATAPSKVKRKVFPTNPDGTHEYIGDVEGYSWDPTAKRYIPHTTSDMNAKSEIMKKQGKNILDKLRKLSTFRYKYRGKHDDGQQHDGFMAQHVRKAFGDKAAPGGVKVDMSYMTSANTEAIKELDSKFNKFAKRSGNKHLDSMARDMQELSSGSLSGPSVTEILQSIDNRLKQMSGFGVLGLGIDPSKASNMLGQAGEAAKTVFNKVFKTGKAVGGAAGGLVTGISGYLKSTFERNKDGLKAGVNKLTDDTISLAGLAYNTGKSVVTKVVPQAFSKAMNFGNTIKSKVTEFINKPRDLYIPGLDKPIILASLMSRGFYLDENGKPILTLDDLRKVKGDIRNKAGEIVVTAQQLGEGLIDEYGEKLKNMASSLTGALVNAGINVAGKVTAGFKKMKQSVSKLFSGDNKERLSSRLKGFFGRFGGGSFNDMAMAQILDILKKWDKKGFGKNKINTGMYGGNSQALSDMARDMANLSEGGDSTPGSGMSALKSMGGLASSLFTKGKDVIQNTKMGGKLSGLFKGRLGRFGGKIGGLFSGIGGMFAGSSTPGAQNDQTTDEKTDTSNKPKKPGLMNKLGSSLKNAANKISDLDISKELGRRAGDFRTRLANMRVNLGTSDKGVPQDNEVGPGNGMGMIAGFANFLKNNLGNVFSSATSIFGGMRSIVTTLGKGALGLAKLPFKALSGAGRLAGAGVKTLSAIGRPLASVATRLAGTGVGRFVATQALRTAVVSGALGAATGGGVGLVLSGLSAGIVALGSAVTSPVVLGALAVYGGYKLYKYLTRDNLNEFQKFRYMQYGFGTPSTESYNHRLANLEEYLAKDKLTYKNIGNNQRQVILDDKKIDNKELAKAFDIDPDNEDDVYRFSDWFKMRFKPFFLNTLTALYSANPKAKLSDISSLSKQEKVLFLNAAKFEGGPYNYLEPPVKDLPTLSSNKEEVGRYVDDLIQKSNESKQNVPSTKTPVNGRTEAARQNAQRQQAAAASGQALKNSLNASAESQSRTTNYQSLNDKQNPLPTNAEAEPVSNGSGSGGKAIVEQNNRNKSAPSSIPLATGQIVDGSAGIKYVKLKDSSVNLNGLNPSVLRNFLAMAQEYGELTGNSIQVNSAFRSREEQAALYAKNPGKAAKPGGSLHGFGLAIDANTADIDQLEKLGLMRKYGFTRPVGGETWHMEPAGIQANLALARSNPDLATQMTDASLFKGGSGLGATKGARLGSRDPLLQMQIMEANSKSIDVASTSPNEVISGKMNQITTPSNDSSFKPQSNSTGRIQTASLQQSEKYSFSQNGQYKIDIPTPAPDLESQSSVDGKSTDMGSDDQNFSMDREGILKAIDAHAKKAGVPGKDLQAFAAVESSLNPQAKAGTSSAEGLFQFTRPTWRESMRKYKSKYGLDGSESPQNIKASTLLAGEYMKANLQTVKRSVSNPGIVEAYLAHFLGGNGAKMFLNSNPDAVGAQVFPAPASRNRNIFFDKTGRPRTIGEIYSYIAQKIQRAAKDYGINGINVSTTFPRKNTTGQNLSTSSVEESTSTSVTRPLVAPVSSGDYQSISNTGQTPVQRAPRLERDSVPVPSFMSTSRTAVPVDQGDSPMREMVMAASKSLDVQTKSLQTLEQIRDMVKELVSMRSTPPNQVKPPNTVSSPKPPPMTPIVDTGRVRRQAT